jgi:UTP-glucose-1-phosphate uridylyltransferase
MLEAFGHDMSAIMIAVTDVQKSKMPHCGVASLTGRKNAAGLNRVGRMVGKPAADHPICSARRSFGIVGRYLLDQRIFDPLRELKSEGRIPVQLTDALERLRKAGENIRALRFKAHRHDLGEMIGRTGRLIEDSFSGSGA